MSNCTVIQNITTTLQNKGLIDDKFNIIGNTKDVFPYIDKLNEHARTKYGATEDLVLTKSIPSRLGANATVKVRFNHKVGQYIDSIKKMVDFQSRNNEEENYVESLSEDFEGGEETFASSLSEDENYVEGAPEIKDFLENLRLPITDNFGELLTYKKAQLNTLNKEIRSLSKHTSEKSKELLKQKYKDKKKLENQIQELSDPESTILNMYHSVFTELESMQNDIDNNKIDFDTFDSRLQFFRKFVHTDDFHIFKVLGENYNKDIDTNTDQGYNSLLNLVHKVEENFKVAKEKTINKILIAPKIEQILTGLNTKQIKNSKGELIDNEDYKKSRELLGKDEDYILTIEDLKIVDRDIDYFSKFYFLFFFEFYSKFLHCFIKVIKVFCFNCFNY